MKNPPKKLLINRTLFKRNKDLSDPSPFAQDCINPSKGNKIDSESKLAPDTESLSNLSNSLSDSIDYRRLKSVRTGFVSKEMVTEWIKHILPRPTPFTLMLSSTLYLIAICSTLQQQEGNRWLGVFLRGKLPGCTKVYQKMSWETFENLTSQYCNQNKFLPFKEDLGLQVTGPGIEKVSHKSLLGSSESIYNTLITDIDLYKNQALIQLRSPWNKQLRKEFLGFFPEKIDTDTNFSESCSSNNKQIALRWYKIGASNVSTRIIFPVEDNISTNTIFSSGKAILSMESREFDKLSQNDRLNFSPTQDLEEGELSIKGSTKNAAPEFLKNENEFDEKESIEIKSNQFKKNKSTPTTDLSDSNIVEKLSTVNEMGFGDTLTLNPLAVSFNARYGKNTRQGDVQFRDRLMAENTSVLQYLLPFNKKSVYVKSDSIPSKLDSPYLYSPPSADFTKSSIDLDLLSLMALPQNRANDEDLRAHLKKSLEKAYSRNLIFCQSILKELFYSYGVSAPYLEGIIYPLFPQLKKEDDAFFLQNGMDIKTFIGQQKESAFLLKEKKKASNSNDKTNDNGENGQNQSEGGKENEKSNEKTNSTDDENSNQVKNDSKNKKSLKNKQSNKTNKDSKTSNKVKKGNKSEDSNKGNKSEDGNKGDKGNKRNLGDNADQRRSNSLREVKSLSSKNGNQWFTILAPLRKLENKEESKYPSASRSSESTSGNTASSNASEEGTLHPTDSKSPTLVKSKSSGNASKTQNLLAEEEVCGTVKPSVTVDKERLASVRNEPVSPLGEVGTQEELGTAPTGASLGVKKKSDIQQIGDCINKKEIKEMQLIEGLKKPTDPEDDFDQKNVSTGVDNFSFLSPPVSDGLDQYQEEIKTGVSGNKDEYLKEDLLENEISFGDSESLPTVNASLPPDPSGRVVGVDKERLSTVRGSLTLEEESDQSITDTDEDDSFTDTEEDQSFTDTEEDQYLTDIEENESVTDIVEDDTDQFVTSIEEDKNDRYVDVDYTEKDENKLYIDNLLKELFADKKTDTDGQDNAVYFQELLSPDLRPNGLISPRLMSGYNFPELKKEEVSSLFKRFLIPHVVMGGNLKLTAEELINRLLLCPLQMDMPPLLPLSSIKDLAFPFLESTPVPPLKANIKYQYSNDLPESRTCLSGDSGSAGKVAFDTSLIPAGKLFNTDIQYRSVRLEELSEVKRLFDKFGRDYEDYLSRPTENPMGIEISPSLEDDELIKEEHKRILEERERARLRRDENEPEPEYELTKYEILEEIRESEKRFEESKNFRKYACNTEFAYDSERKDNDFQSYKNLNPWIFSRVGHQNMLSDRKYTFFGRMNFLPKKFVSQLQKDINENILHNGEAAPCPDQVAPRCNKNASGSLSYTQKSPTGSLPLRSLVEKAQKDLIYLLEAPDIEIHNSVGVHNRKYRPDLRLQVKPLKGVYSRQNWQKRKMRSTLLGPPTHRHVVMPKISVDQWKSFIELELKRYFLEEGKRLKNLVERNPEKTYKIKKINVYLPWVVVRKPRDRSFEWPLTRLDYPESPISTQFDKIRFTKFGSSFPTVSEKLGAGSMGEQSSYSGGAKLPPEYPIEVVKQQYGMDSRSEYIPDTVKQVTFRFPKYEPVEYWGYRNFDTLSTTKNRGIRKGVFDKSEIDLQDGISQVVINKQFLFEPITNQSYLFIYRLFLALAVKEVFKYIYRVSLKNFVMGIINSELGLRLVPSRLRDRIRHAPPKKFYKPSKRLRDVAGGEDADIIPVLSEIIWSLRNRGRGRATPRGVIVVGPSGTDKTALIQAIAGEAEVPIIVQSLTALTLTYNKPYDRLQRAFNLARKKAPCVLFLDSLDGIGKSRSNVVNSYIGPKNSLLALDPEIGETKLRFDNISSILETDLFPKRSTGSVLSNALSSANTVSQNTDSNTLSREKNYFDGMGKQGNRGVVAFNFNTSKQKKDAETVRINLLLQILTEMDGIKGVNLNGVVVIATTEQPALLDPALLRPGRFDRKIHLPFPKYQKRIDLFKVETNKIGVANSMPWDYFALRTANMSGIDILSAINHSAIRAILDDTVHTVETLEHGLNCVIGLPNKKIKTASLHNNDPFHTSRLAFYQAGRCVVHTLLIEHPNLGFYTLTEPVPTSLQTVLMNDSHFYQSKSKLVTENQKSQNSPQKQIQTQVRRSITTDPTSFISQNEKDIHIQRKQDQIANAYYLAVREQSFLTILNETSSNDTPIISLPQQPRYPVFKNTVTTTQHKSTSTQKGDTISSQQEKELTNGKLSIRTRIDLETRLLGLYAGKAGELLHLSTNNPVHPKDRTNYYTIPQRSIPPYYTQKRKVGYLWQSNLGFSELLAASSLIHLMVDRWYLYSSKVFTFKSNQVRGSLNHEQMRNEQFFPIFQPLKKRLDSDKPKPGFWGTPQYENNYQNVGSGTISQKLKGVVTPSHQDYAKESWPQAKVFEYLEMSERRYGKWYRIYLPKLDQNERNEEWVPPDLIFHPKLTTANVSKKRLNTPSSLKTLNDLYQFERDFQYQNVVLNCFYTAFNLLNENRELLDLLADHLIRFKILRSYEISKICSLYLQSPSRIEKSE